jgi:DNA-binding Lrp family transcriptional regulator
MLELISELTKNAKKSDRDIAKILGISQPTVTRLRKKLEDKGYISEYTTILDLSKLGFEIVSFVFFKTYKVGGKRVESAAHNMIRQNPHIVFAGFGNGLHGQNTMLVCIHKDFTEYTKCLEDFKKRWENDIDHLDSFLVSIKSFSPKPFTFRDIGKLIKN